MPGNQLAWVIWTLAARHPVVFDDEVLGVDKVQLKSILELYQIPRGEWPALMEKLLVLEAELCFPWMKAYKDRKRREIEDAKVRARANRRK